MGTDKMSLIWLLNIKKKKIYETNVTILFIIIHVHVYINRIYITGILDDRRVRVRV